MRKNTNFNVVLLRDNKISETLICKKRFNCDGFNKEEVQIETLYCMITDCVDLIENKLKWDSIELLHQTTRLDIPQTMDIVKTNINYYLERDKYDEDCKIIFLFNNKPIISRSIDLNNYQFKLREVVSNEEDANMLLDKLINIFNEYHN